MLVRLPKPPLMTSHTNEQSVARLGARQPERGSIAVGVLMAMALGHTYAPSCISNLHKLETLPAAALARTQKVIVPEILSQS